MIMMNEIQTLEIEAIQDRIRHVSQFIADVKLEVNRFIVGQEALINRLLIGLLVGGHVLVEGFPGLAKTLSIKLIARALGCSFSRIQFTPDLLPADILGTTIYDPREHRFSIKKGPIFANLILADEINRAPAKVQSALLEAMQENQVTIGGESHALPSPFMVMATQNPIEQEGTYPLPEAQTDRFLLKVIVDYPSRQEERLILERMAHTEPRIDVTDVSSIEAIQAARQWVDKVYVDPKIIEYILDIIFATRTDKHDQLSTRQKTVKLENYKQLIQYGASPRASLSLTVAAKALAFLQGRAYVLPHDVKEIALDVLRHRIIPTYEAEAQSLDTNAIIQNLLAELHTP